MYSGFTDKKVRLAEKGSKRYIQVNFDGFEYLGLWLKLKINVRMCALSHGVVESDTLGVDVDIEYRIGNVKILPQQNFSRSYIIEFEY